MFSFFSLLCKKRMASELNIYCNHCLRPLLIKSRHARDLFLWGCHLFGTGAAT